MLLLLQHFIYLPSDTCVKMWGCEFHFLTQLSRGQESRGQVTIHGHLRNDAEIGTVFFHSEPKTL